MVFSPSPEPLPHPPGRPENRSTHPRDTPPPHRPDRTEISRRNSGRGGGRRSSAADKRQGRRKAPRREDHGAVAGPQPVRRLPVGGDEGSVSFIELVADLPRGGMDEGRIGLLRAVGPLVGMLLEDRRAAETAFPVASLCAAAPSSISRTRSAISFFWSSGERRSQHGSGERVTVSGAAKRFRSCSSPRRRAPYSWVRSNQSPPAACLPGELGRRVRRASPVPSRPRSPCPKLSAATPDPPPW